MEMARTSERYPGVQWVEGTGEFIVVDPEKCNGCGNCVKVCLGGCYEISGKKARIKSLDECMECAACWYACEGDAIDFSWPRGGTGFRSDWG
jgi:NAD-dependent dihydropyrimidine dehydrogenase PreA subunit